MYKYIYKLVSITDEGATAYVLGLSFYGGVKSDQNSL